MESQHDVLCSNRTIVLRFDANPRWIQRLRGVALLLLVGLLFSGCGGGGGGGGVGPRTDTGSAPTSDTTPDRTTEPTREPAPPDPRPQCIPTTDFGCISSERYDQERNRIAQTYAASTGFSNQWALAAVNADQAWAHLELARGSDVEPGEGVTIGVIDTRIDHGHPSFAGRTIPEEPFHDFGQVPNEPSGAFSHGTSVASLIAARPTMDPLRDGSFFGVAPGADLKMFAVSLGTAGSSDYNSISLARLGEIDPTTANVFAKALSRNVDILNLSFGVPGIVEKDNYKAAELRMYFGQTIAALEQRGRAEKTILVWAAGNANGRTCRMGTPNCVGGTIDASSIEVYPGLVARIEALRGHSIAVVSVDLNGDIAASSNRCGIAANWCLAAPGQNVRVAYFGAVRDPILGVVRPGQREITEELYGTSFAAPMVAGGLAVMKSLFRDQLSNTELVTRLFATADKSGRYADRSIYGQGMMDLGAATRPVGNTMVAGGDTVSDGGIGLRLTSLRLGGAFGDALGQSLAGQEIAAFDALGAPFWFRLADLTGNTPVPSSLLRLYELMDDTPIQQWIGGQLTTLTPGRVGGSVEQDLGYGRLRFGFLETPTGVEGGHFMLARNATTLTLTGANGMAATAFTTSGIAGRAPTSGAALSWRPFDVPVGFRAGWLNERGTLLGTAAAGAFGSLSADAAFAGVETGFDVGTWRLSADAELGTAVPRLRGGMMTRMSSLTTSAFALHATRRLTNGGSVRVSVSQPLRVEEGRAALSVPIGRTKSGAVLRSSLAADMTPSGRQMNVSAQWRHPFADRGELRFAATWMRHPGHSADAAPGLRLLAGWRFAF